MKLMDVLALAFIAMFFVGIGVGILATGNILSLLGKASFCIGLIGLLALLAYRVFVQDKANNLIAESLQDADGPDH